ncbi:conserved hypothetical protein [Desulfamplus magnetovallimortis]|uniref:NGG1p interacting factor NIF3 n=1 Tax=Desulfamplus magnetovallimortis TaxID=1246637 RepID=A0A1W1H710_9BACT|nr:NGG1p interacting factor NIF3 [Desulfamplus magnetovallimortis]SLM28247.1 conserved hypothetical protein [Desulfamplus magnetovallimortis]
MYLIVFYIPKKHLEDVKKAMFNAGAGRIGNYDSCCWETDGRGQFKPLKGSAPFQGAIDRIEHVDEVKVEMVCDKKNVVAALKALVSAHPYESPAYHAVEVMTLEELEYHDKPQ